MSSMDKGEKEGTMKEISLMQSLAYPHIIRIKDHFDMGKDKYAIIMTMAERNLLI